MRPASFVSRVWCVAVLCLFGTTLFAQERPKPRIAVFPFDDRTAADKDMNIGTKVADLLIAKLATNNAFTVYDRQYVDRILAEKDRKYDPNYDSANAAKSGLMGTVDLVVSGQVDSFNANTKQVTAGMYFTKTVETDGAVELSVTARFISVEKGSIILAPTANATEKGVLDKASSCTSALAKHMPQCAQTNQQQTTVSKDQALRKLVDQAAETVTKQLVGQIEQSATNIQPGPATGQPATGQPAIAQPATAQPATAAASETHAAGVRAAFVGISGGLGYIDKGSEAGVKAGQKFTISRSVDTGLKTSAGKPIVHHKAVCTLIVSSVEEGSAAGKCIPDGEAHGAEGVPHTGDEAVLKTE